MDYTLLWMPQNWDTRVTSFDSDFYADSKKPGFIAWVLFSC